MLGKKNVNTPDWIISHVFKHAYKYYKKTFIKGECTQKGHIVSVKASTCITNLRLR